MLFGGEYHLVERELRVEIGDKRLINETRGHQDNRHTAVQSGLAVIWHNCHGTQKRGFFFYAFETKFSHVHDMRCRNVFLSVAAFNLNAVAHETGAGASYKLPESAVWAQYKTLEIDIAHVRKR